MKTKELKRTCDRCSTVWYLTAAQAKERPPTDFQIWTRGRSGATGFKTKKKVAIQQGMREERDRIQARGQCPNCGSVSFTEEAAD